MRKNIILETGFTKKIGRLVSGFTLVELIVVITILAILGTIAIMAFSGYSKNARDSARLSDIGNIKNVLELWILQSGTYPQPTNGVDITYSGAIVWTQGAFGESVFQTVEKLDKKPLDPLYNTEYTYSVTKSKKEYQIGAVLEETIASISPDSTNFGVRPVLISVIPQTYAAEIRAKAYVTGNYNGILTTLKDTPSYVIALPSIILSDTTVRELKDIDSNLMVYEGKSNLPASYRNVGLTMTGSDFSFTPVEVWSGANLSDLNNQTAFSILVTNIQDTYKNYPVFSSLPEYTAITSETNNSEVAMQFTKTLIETNTKTLLTEVDTTTIPPFEVGDNVSSVPGETALYAGVYTAGHGKTLWVAGTGSLRSWGTAITTNATGYIDGSQNTQINDINYKSSISGIRATGHSAGDYCANLNRAGYEDWYVPAMSTLSAAYCNSGELQFLYCQHKGTGTQSLLGLGGAHWSSTVRSSNEVNYLNNGAYSSGSSGLSKNVHCVRAAD